MENHVALTGGVEPLEPRSSTAVEFNNSNIWEEWFPESALDDVLAGRDVVPDIGQVKGAWKRQLEKEVKAGRLTKWRGKWFPCAGSPFGIGPDKTCYGTPELRDYFAGMKTARAKVAS